MTLERMLLLSFLIFAIGLFGVLVRRHLIGLLLSLELMFNSVNLAILAIAWQRGWLEGTILVLFGIAITVAEVAVGLSLFLLAERLGGTVRADDLSRMRG
ncbi:MAG TPA: NADH-quinone oxidoreductase subunit NuoK [Candidatus Polarisedimenticolaceae bacterium]|nr:NADH-quinone oxidoreductase subunit NuoK [Candidatus Polarisedimenticolaceae bacterium]